MWILCRLHRRTASAGDSGAGVDATEAFAAFSAALFFFFHAFCSASAASMSEIARDNSPSSPFSLRTASSAAERTAALASTASLAFSASNFFLMSSDLVRVALMISNTLDFVAEACGFFGGGKSLRDTLEEVALVAAPVYRPPFWMFAFL